MISINFICKAKKSAIRMVSLLLLCTLCLCTAATVHGEQVSGPEYEVKLGFIYNFINFITWPPELFESDSDELVMCVASQNPASKVLYRLDGKRLKGRTIKVIPYEEEICLEQSHVLFFASQDITFIQQVLDLTRDRSILTIGEVEGFTRIGGTINFFKEHNRLRFKINIDAAQRHALKMSSQLLGSAQIIRERPE